jgi:hypothetical protein
VRACGRARAAGERGGSAVCFVPGCPPLRPGPLACGRALGGGVARAFRDAAPRGHLGPASGPQGHSRWGLGQGLLLPSYPLRLLWVSPRSHLRPANPGSFFCGPSRRKDPGPLW